MAMPERSGMPWTSSSSSDGMTTPRGIGSGVGYCIIFTSLSLPNMLSPNGVSKLGEDSLKKVNIIYCVIVFQMDLTDGVLPE